jgi:hypothetical protein
MSTVVHLKWGEQPPSGDLYLLVTRQGRIRGEDFYVSPSAPLTPVVVGAHAAFASLDSALREAETVARRHGVETIYVRLA